MRFHRRHRSKANSSSVHSSPGASSQQTDDKPRQALVSTPTVVKTDTYDKTADSKSSSPICPLNDRARGVLEAVAIAAESNPHHRSRLKHLHETRSRGQRLREELQQEEISDVCDAGRKTRREAAAQQLTRWPSALEDSFDSPLCTIAKLDPGGNEVEHVLLIKRDGEMPDRRMTTSRSGAQSRKHIRSTGFLPSPRKDRPLWLPPPTPTEALKPYVRGAERRLPDVISASQSDPRSDSYRSSLQWPDSHATSFWSDSCSEAGFGIDLQSLFRSSPEGKSCLVQAGIGPRANLEEISQGATPYPQQSLKWRRQTPPPVSSPQPAPAVVSRRVEGAKSPSKGDMLGGAFVPGTQLDSVDVEVEIQPASHGSPRLPLRLDWHVRVRLGPQHKMFKGEVLLPGTVQAKTGIFDAQSGQDLSIHASPRFFPRPLLLPSVSSGSLQPDSLTTRSFSTGTTASTLTSLEAVSQCPSPALSASPIPALSTSASAPDWTYASAMQGLKSRVADHSKRLAAMATARVEGRRGYRLPKSYIKSGAKPATSDTQAERPMGAGFPSALSTSTLDTVSRRARVRYDVSVRPSRLRS